MVYVNTNGAFHLTTTSYSSIREPRDLLDRIPPFPTMMHLLQLRLQRWNKKNESNWGRMRKPNLDLLSR